MLRLYINHAFQKETKLALEEKQLHYLKNVMRLKDNDTILVFNGKEGLWQAQVHFEKKQGSLFLEKEVQEQCYLPKSILCPAIIKNMDFVLQKATEMGITDIYPLLTQHTVVRKFNQERAQSIVEEACEQSERLDMPQVHTPITLSQMISLFQEGYDLFFLAERMEKTTDNIAREKVKTPVFVVGPEGGFTKEETRLVVEQNNAYPVHFPDTILRAETASLAIVACWRYAVFK